jgi:hypothetical protein
MIRIEQGSIFDAKCDLLVIPCDTNGGVTHAVFENLSARNLPTAINAVPFGKVHFLEVKFENASTLAYAAAVDFETVSSSQNAVGSVARDIRQHCRDNGILSVNIPLLGSGAGRLSPLESFKALFGELEGDPRTNYKIFCLDWKAYQDISVIYKPPTEPEFPRPRVFLSYARNDKNLQWVRGLAEYLRKNGVDARLDLFHLKPGFDMPQWMTNEVLLANKILLICDSHYLQKADFRKGGVGWETMIIQGDMLSHGDNGQKYIAIVREDAVEKALPIFLRSRFALQWGKEQPTEAQLEELLLRLFDCDTAPELGKIAPHVLEKLRRATAASS